MQYFNCIIPKHIVISNNEHLNQILQKFNTDKTLPTFHQNKSVYQST